MRFPLPQSTPPSWLRLPRRTARLRLTALYGGLFLLSGVVLLTISYVLSTGVDPQREARSKSATSFASTADSLNERAAWRGAARQLASDRHQLLVNFAIALAIATVVALVLGWFVAGRVLRPLATITATARRISTSNLQQRLAIAGPNDELKELGDTLDELLARLEASFEAQRHFVANASHELRTPVTRDRTVLQVALDDPSTSDMWRSTGQKLLASNREQERLIEALLTLASSEGGLEEHEPIDLSAVTVEALLTPRPDIDRLGLHIQVATQPAVLDGDPLLIQRLVDNLIDNAVRHNVASGRVQVSTGAKDGKARLSVTNTGAIIPPGEVDLLFQPFGRLNGRRVHRNNGHGLGLSIVRAIATAHGATIDARRNEAGGLDVEVRFPPAPATRPDGTPIHQSANGTRSHASSSAGDLPPAGT